MTLICEVIFDLIPSKADIWPLIGLIGQLSNSTNFCKKHLFTTPRTIFVQIFATNRHLEQIQMCPPWPKWAFSVITVFLYSGLWQTHFSTFEKRNRPHSRPFGPELLSSILVLHSISWSVRLPAPWYIYEARLYNVVRL